MNLKKRKAKINDETEEIRKKEKERLGELTQELYKKNLHMQQLQKELEALSEENSRLEKNFEANINEKNSHQREVGQVINAINNISLITHKLVVQKAKKAKVGIEFKEPVPPTLLKEDTPELLKQLKDRLSKASEFIGDLVQVEEEMKKDPEAIKEFQKYLLEPSRGK